MNNRNDALKSEVIKMDFGTMENIDFNIPKSGDINITMGDRSTGTTNYNVLSNKPQINGVTLIDNKLSEELGLQDTMNALSIQEIERILYLD